MKCKKGLKLEEEVQDNGCDNALPSVISPNMIIGSLMVGETINYFSGNFQNKKIVYNTKRKEKIKAYDENKNKCGCEGGENEWNKNNR